MAVREKSAAVDDFEEDLGRESLRGEKTTIDESYLDGLSSKLDSEPQAPRFVTKLGNGEADGPLLAPPEVAVAPTGPVKNPTRGSVTATSASDDIEAAPQADGDEAPGLGSFDGQPIPSEPTNPEVIEESDDDLAAVATKIFVGEEASAQVPQLEVTAGRDRGKVFPLSADTICIGRGIDNDVILTDIAVSRRHLKVHRRDGYYELEDLGSGNGTSRNGTRVRGRAVLAHGDRLELGNTTFSFSWEGAPPPGALEPTGSVDLHSPLPLLAPPARAATEQIARPVEPGGGGPGKLVIFGGLALIAFVVGAIVLVKLSGGSTEPATTSPAATPSIQELQAAGITAFTTRQWDAALSSFEQLARVAPGDPSVRDYITRSQEERQAEQALRQARALASASPRDAITTLAAIPATSVYASDAATLRTEVTARRVAELLGLVQAARQQPAPDGARILALVDEGLTLDRANAQLLQVRSELGAGALATATAPPTSPGAVAVGPAPMPAVGPAPAPSPAPASVAAAASSDQSPSRGSDRGGRGSRERPTRERPAREPLPANLNARVLAVYKQGRFREAADAAAAVADSATGRAADQARALSTDIERFSTAWSAAQAARGDLPAAIRNLESALRLDRSISGGHYGSQISPLLLAAHTQNATRAWQAHRYPSACQSVQAALRIDRANATAVNMSRDCAAKARELFEQASAMRASDASRARELWRQVLQMVSRDNEFYTRAYERLNNSAGAGGPDEDE